MKTAALALLAIPVFLLIGISCQKGISPQTDISKGTLKLDSTGDCLPSTVNGVYKVDTALGKSNYIDIQILIATAGYYDIHSDKVNGYSFSATGVINAAGLNTIRLQGVGKPIASGINNFTIVFDTSSCKIAVNVLLAASSSAVYTLADASGNCTGAGIAGVYTAGTALNNTNYLEINANVTAIGAYSLTGTLVDGISFSGSGVFTTTGVQKITLLASGTPINAGNFNVAITGTANCTYALTVLPATPAAIAVYTLNCSPVVLTGSFTASTTMTVANTAKIFVTVSSPGTYNLTSTTVNGVSFSATNTFATASTTPQAVILTASGNPIAAGSYNFPVSGNGATCTFSVVFAAAPSPAVYTLAGAPGVCTTPIVNGTYLSSTPLTTANTVIVKVDVTSPGAYTLSTNTVNGIKFSGSGVFVNAGAGQSITLTGTGTPTAAGTATFTPVIGSSSCTFSIPITSPPVATGIYSCKIDGVLTKFEYLAEANLVDGFGDKELYLHGDTGPGNGNNVPRFQIFIINNDGSAIKAGTYNVDGVATFNGYRLEVDYDAVLPDNTVILWNTSSSILSANPPFVVVVSSVTASRVKGTFSGKLTDINEGHTKTKTVTEGIFDLPIK